tara:strand:+ start:1268 stop:2239 length:972 start_codon:yes stop_codon:yes gene_type:complete
MVEAIVLEKFGSPANLKYQSITLNTLKSNELKIKQTAIGVNFLDIYHRSGNHFKNLSLPGIIGVEGVGIIEDIHSSVSNFAVGDKIGYPLEIGGYASHRNIKMDACIKLPNELDDIIIAGSLMKGLTVSHILNDIIKIQKGDIILWHAAAGGVGLIACQWAKSLGATVIGTAGSDEKIEILKEYGCDYVINYSKEAFAKKIFEITDGNLCDAVVDGVGKTTWLDSLKSVKQYGKCISFGLASGALPAFGFEQLPAEGYVTRATIASVVQNKKSFYKNTEKYFNALKNGFIKPRIANIFDLKDAKKAHEVLELRKNIGSVILKP